MASQRSTTLLTQSSRSHHSPAAQAGWFPEWTLTEDFALGIELKKLNWQCRWVGGTGNGAGLGGSC